jgi:hypothetical protein
MTERAGSGPNDTAPGTLAVSVSRTRDGGLIIAVRYSYEGRPPSSKKRIEMAKAEVQAERVAQHQRRA